MSNEYEKKDKYFSVLVGSRNSVIEFLNITIFDVKFIVPNNDEREKDGYILICQEKGDD